VGNQGCKSHETNKAMVWIWLQHRSWKAKSSTFRLSNKELEREGVTRFMKYRALHELEAAGLITIKRQHKKTSVVTLIE
jgi:hypothetical protein